MFLRILYNSNKIVKWDAESLYYGYKLIVQRCLIKSFYLDVSLYVIIGMCKTILDYQYIQNIFLINIYYYKIYIIFNIINFC